MSIGNLPHIVTDLLYDWQLSIIEEKVVSPFVAVTKEDPVWPQLDKWLNSENNIMDFSQTDETTCTVHELFPEHNAVWIMDDYPYIERVDVTEAIIINTTDLQIIREEGLDGFLMHVLLRDF